MTLNKQLLCVSLLLLSLPWAGCQYLKEMDASLRQGQEKTLEATAEVIATALAQFPENLHPHGKTALSKSVETPISTNHENTDPSQAVYCHPLSSPIRADGYSNEWPSLPPAEQLHPDQQQRLRYYCGIYQEELAIFFYIDDKQLIYNNPTLSLASNGDRLILATGSGNDYIFTAVAPGKITTRYFKNPHTTYRESQIDAAWVDRDKGYQLEIKMPLSLAQGKLSFAVIDESDNRSLRYGPYKQANTPPWFVYQTLRADKAITMFADKGLRLRLINPEGLLLATAGNPEPEISTQPPWLLRKLYRALLSSSDHSKTAYPDGINFSNRKEVTHALSGVIDSRWYKDPKRSNHHFLTTAVPITFEEKLIAVLIAEQSSEQTAALTDQAFGRLFFLSVTVISITALALLAYASWLSWRIRRLSRATQQALDEQGNLSLDFPRSLANDEIGSLTRNYAELMKRIHEYTDYLQTLSRKLSHELRTPLAIIHSSLDNLASQTLDEQSQVYQQRAKTGALRLGNILTSMSEARRVEEIIEHAECEKTNIAELLWEVTSAYKDLYRNHNISLSGIDVEEIDSPEHQLMAVPDLIVQMLDKLMENAASFCPTGGSIVINFQSTSSDLTISIYNEGPLLPNTMQNQLFDNMVSLRDNTDDKTHLGLGLHIVRLIVTYHQGSVSAENNTDKSGVIFTVHFPKD